MTIDERLEKLTERHEALTQTVELMAIENRERDKRFERFVQTSGDLISQLMEGTARLLHTAQIHERRLDEMDHRVDRLESQ